MAAAGAAGAQPSEGLESVIVYAEKREAPIQEVPISISALSSEELSAAGVTDADGLARQLTTLDLQRNAGLTTTSLRIRRVGNIGNIPTFEPAVGVFVDGAFRSRSFLGTSNLLAVDHVEELRGPQTALYGKNVSAGLLALYTHKPADRLSAYGEATGSSIDSAENAAAGAAMLDVSGPLAPNLGGGIAARFTRNGSTLVNDQAGGPNGANERQAAVRVQLSWSPDPSLDLRLLAGGLHERDEQGQSDVFLAPGAASTQVADLLQQLGLIPDCPDNVPRNRRFCSFATNELDLDAKDLTLLGEYRFANQWRLSSTTGWDRYQILRAEDDAIQLFAPMLFYHDAERSRSIQEELRLQSANNTALTWLVGGFYYRNVYERGDHGRQPMFGVNGELAFNPIWPMLLGIPLAVPGQLGIHDSQLYTRYRSVFGQISWRLTPTLRVTTALRWQREDKDATIDNSVTAPGVSLISAVLTPTLTTSGQPVNGALTRTSNNVPWSVTPQYFFSDNAMAYFTLAHGSKSGGFNTGFGDAPLAAREFADETIHHYELGLKVTLANRRLLLDAAAFYTRYDNYQDAAFISAQFSVDNAERVDLKGMELAGSALLRDHLTADFSVSLANLEYVTYTHGLCYPGRAPDGSTPNSCVLSGEHPIQAPKWETHLGVRYELPLRRGAFSARLDWSWTDSYNTSFSADPRLTQARYSDVSLRIGLQFDEHYELVFWGDNVLNETVSQFDSLLNLFNDASYQSYLAAPRSYGITMRVRF